MASLSPNLWRIVAKGTHSSLSLLPGKEVAPQIMQVEDQGQDSAKLAMHPTDGQELLVEEVVLFQVAF